MDKGKRYINLYLDNAMLKRIDDYRFENRVPTRTEAIRTLLDSALSQHEPKPTVRKHKS